MSCSWSPVQHEQRSAAAAIQTIPDLMPFLYCDLAFFILHLRTLPANKSPLLGIELGTANFTHIILQFDGLLETPVAS